MSKVAEVEAHEDSVQTAAKAAAPPMQASFGATLFKASTVRGAIERRVPNHAAIDYAFDNKLFYSLNCFKIKRLYQMRCEVAWNDVGVQERLCTCVQYCSTYTDVLNQQVQNLLVVVVLTFVNSGIR